MRFIRFIYFFEETIIGIVFEIRVVFGFGFGVLRIYGLRDSFIYELEIKNCL